MRYSSQTTVEEVDCLFCFVYSGWICSGCSCGYRSSDSASHSIFCCDSTQGEIPLENISVKIYSQSEHKESLVITIHLCCLPGPCSFWFGHLSDACRPWEEVHTGTFTGLLSCSAYSCHHHLLYIACSKKAHIKVINCTVLVCGIIWFGNVFVSTVWQFISEPAQCNRCGNALLRWDFPLRGHSTCSPRDQQ